MAEETTIGDMDENMEEGRDGAWKATDDPTAGTASDAADTVSEDPSDADNSITAFFSY